MEDDNKLDDMLLGISWAVITGALFTYTSVIFYSRFFYAIPIEQRAPGDGIEFLLAMMVI